MEEGQMDMGPLCKEEGLQNSKASVGMLQKAKGILLPLKYAGLCRDLGGSTVPEFPVSSPDKSGTRVSGFCSCLQMQWWKQEGVWQHIEGCATAYVQ